MPLAGCHGAWSGACIDAGDSCIPGGAPGSVSIVVPVHDEAVARSQIGDARALSTQLRVSGVGAHSVELGIYLNSQIVAKLKAADGTVLDDGGFLSFYVPA